MPKNPACDPDTPRLCESTSQWLADLGEFLTQLEADDPEDEWDLQDEIRLTINNVESLLSRLENL